MIKLCRCGSGLPRREIKDGYGIFLTFVCDQCERERLAEFRPDIMSAYGHDEPLEDD